MLKRILISTLCIATLGLVYAGEHKHEHNRTTTALSNSKFKQECSSCHIAYSPSLLPASTWQKIMSGLDKHFGTDASLDTADKQEITQFLINNASTHKISDKASLRITESKWFLHAHDELSATTWHNPKIKSPAHCNACHPKAEQGDFNEHQVRIPR